MVANEKNYKIIKFTNCKCMFSSSQVCKFKNYKIINCMCSFVNFKFTKLEASQFTKLKILKLQVHVCKYVKLPNYKVTNCKCTFACLQVGTC
jgi:hypothetical protein